MAISATILAGVEIDNANVVGADIYSAHVDIYYPDWNGELQNIGYLKETNLQDEACNVHVDDSSSSSSSKEDDRGRSICISDGTNPSPFFSIQSRGVSTSKPGAIVIFLQNVKPQTYLNVMKHFLFQRGSIELLVSGVAHVKSPLGIPLSLSLVCDNTIDLIKHPMQIVGKSCLIEGVSTGWTGLRELALEVKDTVIRYYFETDGDVFNRREGKENNPDDGNSSRKNLKRRLGKGGNLIDDLFSSSEVILDWHDF